MSFIVNIKKRTRVLVREYVRTMVHVRTQVTITVSQKAQKWYRLTHYRRTAAFLKPKNLKITRTIGNICFSQSTRTLKSLEQLEHLLFSIHKNVKITRIIRTRLQTQVVHVYSYVYSMRVCVLVHN